MTLKAVEAIKDCQVIAGYTPYIEYLEDLVEGKEIYSTGMRGEIERCKLAIQKVKEGKILPLFSTGDCRIIWYGRSHFRIKRGYRCRNNSRGYSSIFCRSELGSPIMQ